MFVRSQQNQVDTAREERAGFFWTHFKYKLNTMRDFVQVHFSHFVPMQYGNCVYCDSLLAVLSLSSLGTHWTEIGSPIHYLDILQRNTVNCFICVFD